MTPIHELRRDGYLKKIASLFPALAAAGLPFGARVLENPTEEIDEHLRKTGRMPKLHSMAGPGGSPFGDPNVAGRIEENYLYSTRRFPLNTANNTIGGGAVAAQDYNFFTFGVGDPGTQGGYFSLSSMTYMQTNMSPSGKIPSGRGFELYDLAVSFNALATAPDIGALLDAGTLRFEKQGAALVVHHGPIILWPGGVGMAGFAATAVGGSPLTIQGTTNGVPQITAVRRFRNARILSSNEDFKYIINFAASTPAANTTIALSTFIEIRIWLYGYTLDKIPG